MTLNGAVNEQAQARTSTIVLALEPTMEVEIRHYLLGQVLKRIAEFAERYDSDAQPALLMREVETDFLKERRSEREFMIVIAVKEGRVVGHLMAKMEPYYGNRFVHVVQWWMDDSITEEQEKYGFGLIERWKREIGAKDIRCTTLNEARARLFHKKFNFQPHRTVLRRP